MNNKTKRRRPNTKGKAPKYEKDDKGKDVAKTKTYDIKQSTNDVAWYSTDPSLLRDAASIPFSMPAGSKIRWDLPSASETGSDFVPVSRQGFPGLLTLQVSPTMGNQKDPSDPINMAANALYSFVRHANSGSSNYDAPDLMLYVLGVSQVHSYINYLMRIYGVARMYAQRNRYLPKALVEANGVDFESILPNMAAFRYGINVLINKASALVAPTNFTIYQRYAFMYQNVYTEGESIKDQMYMFTPGSWWKYNLNEDGSGMLKSEDYDCISTRRTLDELLEFGNDMIGRFLYSEDCGIMGGDLLKAFGEGGIYKFVSMPEDYMVLPLKDDYVLGQIKNARCIERITGLDVVQNDSHGWLVSDASQNVVGGHTPRYEYFHNAPIISVPSAEPTPEDVMELTRLMVCVKDKEGSAAPIICGTEVPRRFIMWTLQDESDIEPTSSDGILTFIGGQSNSDLAYCLDRLQKIGYFRWAPAIALGIQPSASSSAYAFCGLNWNVDNFTQVSPDTLERIHNTAVMNLLHAPSISKL